MAATGHRATVTYRVMEPVQVERGHWCHRCVLPSAVKIWLISLATIGGVDGPLKMTIGYRCSDCEKWTQADDQESPA